EEGFLGRTTGGLSSVSLGTAGSWQALRAVMAISSDRRQVERDESMALLASCSGLELGDGLLERGLELFIEERDSEALDEGDGRGSEDDVGCRPSRRRTRSR